MLKVNLIVSNLITILMYVPNQLGKTYDRIVKDGIGQCMFQFRVTNVLRVVGTSWPKSCR